MKAVFAPLSIWPPSSPRRSIRGDDHGFLEGLHFEQANAILRPVSPQSTNRKGPWNAQKTLLITTPSNPSTTPSGGPSVNPEKPLLQPLKQPSIALRVHDDLEGSHRRSTGWKPIRLLDGQTRNDRSTQRRVQDQARHRKNDSQSGHSPEMRRVHGR